MSTEKRKKKKQRRAYIFWVFLFIAFPLATGVLGYAAGYRIDRKSKSIVKTSALSVYSTPSDAAITINGKTQNERTPFISTFSPGTYSLTISREGYYDWSTTTTIDSETSALFAHVVLFPQASLLLTDTRPEKKQLFREVADNERAKISLPQFSTSEMLRALDGECILIIDDIKKYYAVLDTSLKTVLMEASGDIVAAEWLDHKLMIATENDIHLFDAKNNITALVTRQAAPITDATFLPSGTHIVFADTEGIYGIEAYPYNVHMRTVLSKENDAKHLVITQNPTKLFVDIGKDTFSLALE